MKKYPTINSTGFQGSENNTPENIEKIFKVAENKIDYGENKMISLLVFDELGLSEKSPTNCLKVLHSKLEMTLNPNDKKLSFIGISNWGLDAAKMNRAIFLSIPEIGIDDIGTTIKAISNSYGDSIYKDNEKSYEFLQYIFYYYKEGLKYLKGLNEIDEFIENYHGGRDLYHIVKIFSSEIKNKKTTPDIVIKKCLLRNLSGLEIEGKNSLKYVLKKYQEKNDNQYIQEFNKIYFDDIRTIDLVKDNIMSKDNNRFLLLISEKSMFDFLINIIKDELEQMSKTLGNSSDNKKISYVNYIGSPFKGDKINVSYQTEMIVNIEDSVAKGKVIILSNLDQIYSIFYDLFNQNYIIKDNKKYCRISHGANIQKLAFVNENTKFIILVDKNDLKKQKLPFLSRFEKHIITFDALLDDKDKEKSKKINALLKKMVSVENINYNLNSIFVNTNEDIINGYVYIYKNKQKNTYKDIIKDKIIPIIPQDIIFTLPFSELNCQNEKEEMKFIKNEYIKNRPNSLIEYLQNSKKEKENILIIYTFSKIEKPINMPEKDNYMELVASEITNVFKFKQKLNELYDKEKNTETKYLILKFNGRNSVNINFFLSEINHYKEKNEIIDNKIFIFTISIERDFNSKEVNKLTTILITDEEMNQLFIDNINGTELTIKDIEGKNIADLIDKKLIDSKKIILEGMLNFYGNKKNERIGNCKGIDNNNLISELKIFIENNNELIEKIKNIILPQLAKTENIINLIIKNNYINQGIVDFTSAILSYLKEGFNKQLEIFLRKSENNNFLTTLFMLNIKETDDNISKNSNRQLKEYSFNISDEELLKNKLFENIIKEFWKKSKENINEEIEDETINIKLNYKIPGFFNIYRGIKKYINDQKITFYYRQDEGELRKCEIEKASPLLNRLKNHIKDFTEKLYIDLTTKQFINKIIESKIDDENYIVFTEAFLNDYITFYLVKLYKETNNDFTFNDISHKIILLLLDLKFKELSDQEKSKIPLQNVVSKILWLEANAIFIKEILDLYNIISDDILNEENKGEILFNEIINCVSKNEIKYEPGDEKEQLKKLNFPYYIVIIILFKSMISKKSIEKAFSKNDNYYSYFKTLERCLKTIQKLDKSLSLDIKELSVIDEFIAIYNAFEKIGKLNNLNINELIENITKNLEVSENNEENKIGILFENLKNLNKLIKTSLYDKSKKNEIKGDKVYYELISKILLNEIIRENSKEYKFLILEEFLLEDEKLFIQSIQLLKLILNDYVSSDIDYFQSSLNNLFDNKLKCLEDKIKNNWIKETLIYIFEQISIIYLQNLEADNEKSKEGNKQNILIYLKSFLNNCLNFLEKLYKDPELKNERDEEKINLNLRKIFALSFTRIYLKIFVNWIDKGKFSKSGEINEIIEVINGEKENNFRDMIVYFICKILYNYKQDINILFDNEIIKKYHLDSYRNFEKIKSEKNNKESAKYIVFIECYKAKDEDLKIFTDEFNLLTKCIEISSDNENELKKLIENNNRLDIFYSVFSTKISSHLSNSGENKNKINLLSDVIHNLFGDQENLTNIFDLFLDKSKYIKNEINSATVEILQYSLKYCILSDKIIEDDDNLYNPLYSGDNINNSFIPGNDIKDNNIYDCYSKIRKYLNENPSNHGLYICTCNINKENEAIFIEYVKGTGYHDKSGNCKYCNEQTGNDGEANSFYERDGYFRIFKNEDDLEKETKNKKNGNCMTLEKFFEEYVSIKFENDSKGVNASKKSHFLKSDKPVRNQSQIGYRLMNLILFSHLFTSVLFKSQEEKFNSDDGLTYLDYIKGNWKKLKTLLEDKGLNIYIFMNLIFKDLFNLLSNQKKIESYEKLLDIEQQIENLIEDKIVKKTEKNKENVRTKYAVFANFYNKSKEVFREMDPKSKISLIKEINSPDTYNDEEYPYYKSFLYSDYPDEAFLKAQLEQLDKEKYPVIDLYLNGEKTNKGIDKGFIKFNTFIKSLLNQNSNKISRNEAKRLTLEKTYLYKENPKICDAFIKIMKKKIKDLTIESNLENFLIDRSNEKGKIYIDMYKKYAEDQNTLLNEIIKKINAYSSDIFECQEINIQEAQKKDLLILEFDNRSKFTEILLSNTFREIYIPNSKIKYNNYNSFSIDFEKIEKILEDIFIRNACILKADEIAEIQYTGEEFLNDGISELNKIITPVNLDDNDKKVFVKFYDENLKENLDSCLEVNEGLKNIIIYINKNNKKINSIKGIYSIITEQGFVSDICESLKNFLKDNKNIGISKLTNLTIYLEKLYFKFALEKKGNDYKQIIDDKTKEGIQKHNEKSGLLITKDEISLAIIRFILNDLMNQKNNRAKLFEIDDNLFDILANKNLWKISNTKESKFASEIEEYKKLGILVKNIYDFYNYISTDSLRKFEEEIQEILEKINKEKKEKSLEKKIQERENERIKIENTPTNPKLEEVKVAEDDDDEDIDEFGDY